MNDGEFPESVSLGVRLHPKLIHFTL
ncbi:AlpA family transcriptional regulator [Vibrio fluvialis]|nr:AlpA family transcriptional regulator [Vibrio fluvialis]MBY8200396.1 AlpA family transcriptional regulator [Vibrio fluvialis]